MRPVAAGHLNVFPQDRGSEFPPLTSEEFETLEENILPLTSEIKRPNQPTHYVLKHTACLDKKSMVVAEQPKTIAKSRIIRYLGKVDPRDMECIDDCIRVQTGLDMTDSIPLCEEFP